MKHHIFEQIKQIQQKDDMTESPPASEAVSEIAPEQSQASTEVVSQPNQTPITAEVVPQVPVVTQQLQRPSPNKKWIPWGIATFCGLLAVVALIFALTTNGKLGTTNDDLDEANTDVAALTKKVKVLEAEAAKQSKLLNSAGEGLAEIADLGEKMSATGDEVLEETTHLIELFSNFVAFLNAEDYQEANEQLDKVSASAGKISDLMTTFDSYLQSFNKAIEQIS